MLDVLGLLLHIFASCICIESTSCCWAHFVLSCVLCMCCFSYCPSSPVFVDYTSWLIHFTHLLQKRAIFIPVMATGHKPAVQQCVSLYLDESKEVLPHISWVDWLVFDIDKSSWLLLQSLSTFLHLLFFHYAYHGF